MRRALCILLLGIVIAMTGCAGIGVWSSTAQTDISNFVTWANQWVGGALQAAPAILTEASTLLGSNNQAVKDMSAATTAAAGVPSALNVSAQAGTVTNTQQANVVAACSAINTAVSGVKAAVAQAQASAPATSPVSTPAPAASTSGS